MVGDRLRGRCFLSKATMPYRQSVSPLAAGTGILLGILQLEVLGVAGAVPCILGLRACFSRLKSRWVVVVVILRPGYLDCLGY
jgi:hypothetical protein